MKSFYAAIAAAVLLTITNLVICEQLFQGESLPLWSYAFGPTAGCVAIFLECLVVHGRTERLLFVGLVIEIILLLIWGASWVVDDIPRTVALVPLACLLGGAGVGFSVLMTDKQPD